MTELKQRKTCKWEKASLGYNYYEYDAWSTECGEDFAITEEWHDTPTPFCSNCGGKTIDVTQGENSNE